MPSANRALTRAARSRAAAEKIPYTKAREVELDIRTRMDETGEGYAEAEAIVTHPANQVICHTCGWTAGMVCPECPGCGCYNLQCSGWRHREYMHPHDLAELEAAEAECPECGGDTRTGYDCHCDEYGIADASDAAADEEDRRVDDAIQAWKDDRAMGGPAEPDPEPFFEDAEGFEGQR
jgi:hypothetical protein